MDPKIIENVKKDLGIHLFAEVVNVKQNARLVVLVSHGFVELMINALIEDKCKNAKSISSDNRGFPHSVRLLILNELGIIDDATYASLNRFRKLRNRAAHHPLFELTKPEMLNICSKINPDAEPWIFFHSLLANFWNAHTDVFVPVFMPSILKCEKHFYEYVKGIIPADQLLGRREDVEPT